MFHWAEKNFDHIIAPLIILLLVFLAAACQKEHFRQEQRGTRIVPVMKSVQTKAQDGLLTDDAMPVEPLSERVVASADGFDLIETVYDINSLPYEGFAAAGGPSISDGDPETKGTPVTSSSIAAFNINAYAEGQWHDNTLASGVQGSLGKPNSAGLYFKAACAKSGSEWDLTKTGGDARTGDAGELYWINDVPMTFWSWNEVEPVRASTYVASFSDYIVPSSVTDQKDLIFAFSKENRKFYDNGPNYGDIQSQSSTSGASNDEINIWFFHALSAVQFIQNEALTGYRVSGVELQNVMSKTSCTITGSETTAAKGSPNITFVHDPSVPANFSQTYTSGDASLSLPSDYATTNKSYKPGDSKTFFMIPQTLGTDAKLKVTFTNTTTGNSETTSPVFDLDGSWEVGKYYVYKLDLKDNIRVEISEQCPANIKSDVKFQNKSSVNEYIRAAVVANWFDDSGNVVAAWDKTRDGDISIGSDWNLGSDGYYYYNGPVKTKDYTDNLFDSFTQPSTPPVTGAHFEMTILVQAVGSDGIESCTAAAFTN